MSKIELPPEPDNDASRYEWDGPDGKTWASYSLANVPEGGFRIVPLFTADQLRAYREQIVEVCIQAAENAEAGDGSHDYNAGAETMQERIVAAIRNLIEESNNG